MARNSEKGQGLIEYALIILLVGIVVGGVAAVAGQQMSSVYSGLQPPLEGATPAPTEQAAATPSHPTPTPIPTPTPTTIKWEDWREVRGTQWRKENGYYCAGPGGEHRSFYGAENWTDYVVTFSGELHKGNGFGVYFRATNFKRANAYIFQYDPGYGRGAFLFRKIVNGRERSPFARVNAPATYQWHNVLRQIKVVVEGDTFTAYVDGQQVLQASDDEYTHGGVGLRTWDGSEACFSDFKVTFIENPERDRDDRDEEEPVEPDDRRRYRPCSLDDFTSGPAPGWYGTRGRWRVKEGMYRVSSGGEHRTFCGQESWTDYTISLKANLRRGKGFGVYFRATNVSRLNAYIFQYDPGYGRGAFLFRKIVNGREQKPLAVSAAPPGYQWHKVTRQIGVRVKGDTFTLYVDGQEVLQAKDDEYTHGVVGLRTWGRSEVWFDDFMVKLQSPAKSATHLRQYRSKGGPESPFLSTNRVRRPYRALTNGVEIR